MITITREEIKKQFGADDSTALTLSAEEMGKNESGWTIEGDLPTKVYRSWVSEFKASHTIYGTVEGSFRDGVRASSRKAYDHFVKHHEPDAWGSYSY